MRNNNKRVRYWIFWIMIAISINRLSTIDTSELSKEKTPITVCAPEDMKKAFTAALSLADLNSDYKIVMTNDPNSNICVDYAKQDDSSYTKFAFSPFVIAYCTNDTYFNTLKESEILIPSEYDKEFYEIDFFKVVAAIIKDGKWSNLGIEDLDTIKIFYPSEKTTYWYDFYNFMLVTVNNGTYPTSEQELKVAKEIIEKFFNSPYTEAVTHFTEKATRVGGFPDNSFYILPEKVIDNVACNLSENTRIFYPTETVYFNYYIKGDEIGTQLISVFEKDNTVYGRLRNYAYRNSIYSNSAGNLSSYITGESDIYNVIQIPEKNFTENSGT